MKRIQRSVVSIVLASVFLTSCAAVDQYGSRVTDGNINAQRAMNEEILLNIIRASREQSLNFVGISQISGGQQETLSTGLPTISLGPHQTIADHIYQVSNSLSSNVTGGYQSSPLISTSFQLGMLSPLSPKTVALLIGSKPREAVFFAVLAYIEIKINNKLVSRLENDPRNDMPGSGGSCLQYRTPFNSSKLANIYPGFDCSYSKFVGLLQRLINAGFTADVVQGSPKDGSSGSGSGAGAESSGNFCFEPSSAYTTRQNQAQNLIPQCDTFLANDIAPKGEKTNVTDTSRVTTVRMKSIKDGSEVTKTVATNSTLAKASSKKAVAFDYPNVGRVEFIFGLRSPIAVFNYIGEWANSDQNFQFAGYVSDNSKLALNGGKYIDVRRGSLGIGCYTSVSYMGDNYCVPRTAQHTAMLMDMLEILRNMNIQPTDLNSSFSVHLSP